MLGSWKGIMTCLLLGVVGPLTLMFPLFLYHEEVELDGLLPIVY